LAKQIVDRGEAKGHAEALMLLSTEMLVGEADRLLARAERAVKRHRELGDTGVGARRAQQELRRLQLYRAVLVSTNTAHAVMPEYAVARGLLRRDNTKSLG